MPPTRPGSLGDATYAQLLAFMLQENGSPAGRGRAPADPAALKAMAAPNWPRVGGGGLAPQVIVPPPPPRINPLDTIRPVTEAMLNKVPDGEWLTWRRTYDAFGFSPLKKITKTNVERSSCRLDLVAAQRAERIDADRSRRRPVHSRLWGQGPGARCRHRRSALAVFTPAADRRRAQRQARASRSYGTRLYVPTSDAHIVALDVKTGKVVWDQAVADPKKGYRMTGGPLVARGKVMVGTTGRAEGGNYIAALDAETGKEAWRFYTIARPDEGGGQSWNGLPLEKRNGGSVWIPGSYDPVHNLAFFAPGNTYDTGPLRNLINQPGVTNDALYLDSTLAIDPDTGSSPGTSSTRRTASGISTGHSSGWSCSCRSTAAGRASW